MGQSQGLRSAVHSDLHSQNEHFNDRDSTDKQHYSQNQTDPDPDPGPGSLEFGPEVVGMVHYHFSKYVALLQQEPKKVQVVLD